MAASLTPFVQHLRRLAAPAALQAETDADLLERFTAARDQAAFAALIARHGPMVLRVCRRVLGDAHAAEDALQATLVILARKAGSLRRPEGLAAWLYGVAYRVARKARAGLARHAAQALPGERDAPAATAADPLARLSAREVLLALEEEVRRLPEAQRLPVVLVCLEGLSREEAADRLGCTSGSIKGRLERGRRRLHDRLVKRGLTLAAALAAAEVSRAGGEASASLLVSTVKLAAGEAAAGCLSAAGAALAEGVLRAMFVSKLKIAALVVLTAGAAVTATVNLTPPAQAVQAAERLRPLREQAGEPGEEAATAKSTPARQPARVPRPARAVARVNGQAILAAEIEAAAYLALPDAHRLSARERARATAATWGKTFDRVIEREVVLQHALAKLKASNPSVLGKLNQAASREFERQWLPEARRRAGLRDDAALGAALRAQGTSLEALRRQWQRACLAREYLRSRCQDFALVWEVGSEPAGSTEVSQREVSRIISELKRQAVIEILGEQ